MLVYGFFQDYYSLYKGYRRKSHLLNRCLVVRDVRVSLVRFCCVVVLYKKAEKWMDFENE